MCGIVGKVSIGKISEKDIYDPLEAIKHRGPDYQSIYFNEHVILGHARLSIIDINNGSQPISCYINNKKFIIVYNGEVFNFKELQNELKSYGIEFSTDSDTEVVLKWLSFHGVEKGIRALNGMFAIALYSESDDEIYLIRDRMGIKPLYFNFNKDSLFFSSELNSLTKFKEVDKSINSQAMQQFLYFGYPIAPNTMYKDIFELKPANFLKYSIKTKKLSFHEYWSIDSYINKNYKGSYSDGINDLEYVLKESISSQTVSDVGYSSFLSGGIDSGVITSMLSIMNKDKFNSYTVSFNDKEYDELPYAKKIVQKYDNINHIIYNTDNFNLNENFVDLILKHIGQPFADSSCIPTYLISKEVSKNQKVILSGDGGDELFMGYETFSWLDKINYIKITPIFIRQLIALFFKKLPMEILIGEDFNRQINKALLYSTESEQNLVFSLNSLLDLIDLQKLTNTKSFEWLSKLKKDVAINISNPYLLLQEFIIKIQLSGDMLRKVDSMSMANSIEVRVPFLDNRVVDFALSLPTNFLYRNGVKKSILKDVAKKYLPESVINHKKWGFAIPMHKIMEKEFIAKYQYLLTKYDLLDKDYLEEFYRYSGTSNRQIYKTYSQYTIDHVNWMAILLYRWIELNKVNIK